MRSVLVAAMLVAGCGGAHQAPAPSAAPSPPDANALVTPEVKRTGGLTAALPRVSAVRPVLDVERLLPDFHDELRWPLSPMSHPELQPQFPIASVFAAPGIGWIELCERGVHNRASSGRNRDELEYLRGWCSAIKGDTDKACQKLTPLLASIVPGLATAVRTDLVNIIGSTGDADAADRVLRKYRLAEPELLDLLAATYVELGKNSDAFEINRQALDNVKVADEVRCRRLVKDIVLSGESDQSPRTTELEALAKRADLTCVALYAALECHFDADKCFAYFRHANIDTNNRHLLVAYRAWPKAGTHVTWRAIAHRALGARHLPGARELATAALDAAIRAAPRCNETYLRERLTEAQDARDLYKLLSVVDECATRTSR